MEEVHQNAASFLPSLRENISLLKSRNTVKNTSLDGAGHSAVRASEANKSSYSFNVTGLITVHSRESGPDALLLPTKERADVEG